MQKNVGIGGYAISNHEGDIIKTHALSSCVAVIAHSPFRKVGGMIHVALPYPLKSDGKMSYPPTHFAATGIPYFIGQMQNRFGCSQKELDIHVFGGANSIRKDDHFRIGHRNLKAVTDILDKMNLSYTLSDTGGLISRTVELEVGTGAIKVYRQPMAV